MPRVLDYYTDVVLLSKRETGNDVVRATYINGIAGVVTQGARLRLRGIWVAGPILEYRRVNISRGEHTTND